MDQYTQQLDRTLLEYVDFEIQFSRNRTRNDWDRYRTDGDQVWLDTEGSYPEVARYSKRRLTLRRRIRDLNHNYAGMFASVLPEPKATAWRRHYRDAVLGNVVYMSMSSHRQDTNDFIKTSITGGPRLDRLVREIRESVPDLDDHQTAALDAVAARRDESLDAALKRVIAAHDELSDSSFRGVQPAEKSVLEARYHESLERITGIEQQSIRVLIDILTPEQREVMEALESDR